jgi:hypothetical protein
MENVDAAYNSWLASYDWRTPYPNLSHVAFPPLFGHQFSQTFIDFRGLVDKYMKEKGIDYFENSRRATLVQRLYAIDNPYNWAGYDSLCWGISASDGPTDKYNFNESISNYLCYDINPFMGINTLLPNLEKIKNFVSFIHTKRYITFTPYEKKFNNIRFDEYNQIFDLLLQKESINSNTNIVSIDNHFDSNMITFNVNNNYSDYFKVILVSLFRPNKEYVYFMNLYDNVNYFIIKEKDVWIKDLHLIVESNKIIHDCTKIT